MLLKRKKVAPGKRYPNCPSPSSLGPMEGGQESGEHNEDVDTVGPESDILLSDRN